MFIPIASLVSAFILSHTFRPTTYESIPIILRNLSPSSPAFFNFSKFSSAHSVNFFASLTDFALNSIERVCSFFIMTASAPPDLLITEHPLLTDATSAPSVVARGM